MALDALDFHNLECRLEISRYLARVEIHLVPLAYRPDLGVYRSCHNSKQRQQNKHLQKSHP